MRNLKGLIPCVVLSLLALVGDGNVALAGEDRLYDQPEEIVDEDLGFTDGGDFRTGEAGKEVAISSSDPLVTLHAGSSCMAKSGSPAISIGTGGVISNTSASEARVTCPMDGPWADTFLAFVWAIDNSSPSNVCCYIQSINASGSDTGPTACTSGYSSTNKQINVPANYFNYSFTSTSLECTIPGTYNGQVSSIRVYRSDRYDVD